MNDDLRTFLENTKKPWGVLYYRLVWEQLSQVIGPNSRILDFGSGPGITANHLAKNNDVTAIEPDIDMIENRIHNNHYQQIIGGIEQLKQLQNNSFDTIVCHNVLDYAKERKDIFKEFCRVVKPNGVISIIKHNHAGRIIAKVAFENNLDDAIKLINGEADSAAYFGKINYYDLKDINGWKVDSNIVIEKVMGVRTLYSLNQNNEARFEPSWQDKMLEIEMKVSELSEFKNISFYNHVLLRKNS